MPDSIQAETSFSYNKALFGGQIGFHLEKKATFEVEIESIKEKEILVIINKGDAKEMKAIWLMEGDTLNLDHTFHIDAEVTVKENHPFPIKLEFKGQTYFLKRTKADKLILTK